MMCYLPIHDDECKHYVLYACPNKIYNEGNIINILSTVKRQKKLM